MFVNVNPSPINTGLRRISWIILFSSIFIFLAGCTLSNSTLADSSSTAQTPDTQAPDTQTPDTQAPGQQTASQQRIVSLSPTATEMVFAIGAGSQVVAVDSYSYYPPEAPTVEDLTNFPPNIEAILGYAPDMVLISNPGPDDAYTQLEDFGVQVVRLPAVSQTTDIYAQILQLGELTQKEAAARQLVAEMESKLNEILQSAPTFDPSLTPLTYFYELDTFYYTVGQNSFISRLLGRLNLESIAPGALGDYPQLNEEAILAANPDIIFLVDVECCGQTIEAVLSRDGWDVLAAVQNQNILELDGDIASRWGPRIVDLLADVVDFLSQTFSPS